MTFEEALNKINQNIQESIKILNVFVNKNEYLHLVKTQLFLLDAFNELNSKKVKND